MNARRSFTLVEVVVVIALIVLLSALVLGVGTAVVKGSENRQAVLLLTQLDTAAKEWQAQSDREIAYGIDNEPFNGARYELTQPVASDLDLAADPGWEKVQELVRKYFAIVDRVAAARQIMATIDSESLRRVPDADNSGVFWLEFHDAWDGVIVVVPPGRTWQASDTGYVRDADGTIRTALEERMGYARNRQTYFVSSGPDGKFGDVAASPDTIEYERTRDNLFSYEPDRPVPP